MWMAELSSRAGLPVPTIKYYLREGLLHPGVATGATRAQYDESHLRRLRLVRALAEIAQLKLDTVREVLAGIESAETWHAAVGSVHVRLTGSPGTPSPDSLARVDALLVRHHWRRSSASPQRSTLAGAIEAIAALDHPVSDNLLDAYAGAMADVAEVELEDMATDHEAAAEHAVIGTLLLEPVLLSVRRIAQENASRERQRS